MTTLPRPAVHTATEIPVFRPLITEDEINAAARSLEIGWLGMGSSVGQFENAIKGFIQAHDRHVVAVSTGHAALHLALMLIGIQPGDEVITPSFNNIADFQAILACGGAPVFCDIHDDTLCIDLDMAEQLITARTKAIVVMDYDCALCDHDRVAEIARRHNIRVIHDAAHSFGSTYLGQMVGSFSDITMFSFDPVKTITCIDGGALVVRSETEARVLREMRLLGMSQPASVMYRNQRAWTYDVQRVGFRYHMPNLHAAIGLAQIAKMPDITRTRRAACATYNAEFSNISSVRVPDTKFDEVTPFLYYIRVLEHEREPLRAFLKARSIDTGIHWQPGHWFTLLKNCRRGDLSVTERVGREIISLPLHSRMADDVTDRVVTGIREYFGG